MKGKTVFKDFISLLTLIFFVFSMSIWADAPGSVHGVKKTGLTASAAAPEEGEGQGFVEYISGSSGKAKKKFPWLLAAAGAVVVGLVLYFTVFKDKKNDPAPGNQLTVTLGTGVSGTPAAGTSHHDPGAVVNYSYSAQPNYKKLRVTLDGAEVAASGTVTMNGAHTLSASAVEGIDEQFNGEASSFWLPRVSGTWFKGSSFYQWLVQGGAMGWHPNLYNHRFSSSQYVLEVRMRRVAGEFEDWVGISLFCSTDMTNQTGYTFAYGTYGNGTLYKHVNQNIYTTPFPQSWKVTPGYLNWHYNWNVVRIARDGSQYTISINGTVVSTFSDSSIDPHYICLMPWTYGSWTTANEFDYVVLTAGTSL